MAHPQTSVSVRKCSASCCRPQYNTPLCLIKGYTSLLVRVCTYSGPSVACVSTGQGEGALAALCSRPLVPWINADCLGMTRSSGPHRESEGEHRTTWGCRRGELREAHREFLASVRPTVSPRFLHFLSCTFFMEILLSTLCFEKRKAAFIPLPFCCRGETPHPR